MLATHGLQDKVLWQTESTQAITTQFGDFQVRRARFQLAYMILFEQYGFAAEKNCPWYDQSHGFWSFPAYLEFGDGSLQPQAVLSRVLAEEFWGKPYASALDFGEAGNSIVFGNIYTSGDTGESVAAVMFPALMHNASVTLTVTGTTDDLVSVGGFGEEGVLEQTDGRVTFSPLDVPFYVRLPAGATVEPYGINGVTIASLATNLALTASSKLIGGQERPEIADGLFMSRYTGNYGSPGEVFSPAATLQSPSGIHTYLPDSAELVWDEDVEVGTLAVWCPPAWQYGTALLNFDIETTLDGVTWDTQKTVDVSASAETFRFGSGGSNAACTIETYWGEQCTFLETLSPSVVCRGVRINVSETSYGGQPDLLGIQTCPDTQGGASGAQLLVLQEFQAYGAGIIPPVQPPVVNTDPVASGTTVVGQDVETTDGLWDNDPTSFAYQWQKSTNGTTGWTNISGATDATYTIGSALNHKFLRAAVTASNDVGESDPAFSNVLGPVTRPSPPHGGSSPGGSMLPGGTTVYLPRKRARKTGFKRRRM